MLFCICVTTRLKSQSTQFGSEARVRKSIHRLHTLQEDLATDNGAFYIPPDYNYSIVYSDLSPPEDKIPESEENTLTYQSAENSPRNDNVIKIDKDDKTVSEETNTKDRLKSKSKVRQFDAAHKKNYRCVIVKVVNFGIDAQTPTSNATNNNCAVKYSPANPVSIA